MYRASLSCIFIENVYIFCHSVYALWKWHNIIVVRVVCSWSDACVMLCYTEPSRITQGPSSMEIMVGESIVLPCQVTVDPALDVSFSWAFNDQLIDFEHDSEHFERVGGVSKNQHCFLADSTVLFCPVSWKSVWPKCTALFEIPDISYYIMGIEINYA